MTKLWVGYINHFLFFLVYIETSIYTMAQGVNKDVLSNLVDVKDLLPVFGPI